jgi:hypothetical protein
MVVNDINTIRYTAITTNANEKKTVFSVGSHFSNKIWKIIPQKNETAEANIA